MWSPDGRQILFSRVVGRENRGVYVISALGGRERQVADWGWRATWLPDSRSIIVAGRSATSAVLMHHDLDTGARRQLTTPPPGFADAHPKVSPDGARVAFTRSTRSQSALFVMPVAGGEPERVDGGVRAMGAPDWTPDSRELIYPRWDESGLQTYRVAADGGTAVLATGLPSDSPGISVSGWRPDGTFRVAAMEARSDIGLRLIDLDQPRLSSWTDILASTRIDWPGRFSRDGARFTLTSDRYGAPRIVIAKRDGSDAQPVNAFERLVAGFAAWSPDSRAVVFDAVGPDHRDDLYIVDIDGGRRRRLTTDDARETDPEWSRDGQWIYFASDRSGRWEIWRIPVDGGTPLQITTQGGAEPRESPDGRALYFIEPFSNRVAPVKLLRVETSGDQVTTVLPEVWPGAWDHDARDRVPERRGRDGSDGWREYR